jgi:lysophospholipase L1-like esterase
MGVLSYMVNRGRVGPDPSPVSYAADNSTVASEQYYNGFPKPDTLPDGRLVTIYKRSNDHASAGAMMFGIKQNSEASWVKSQVNIGGANITAGSMELRALPSGRVIIAVAPTNTSARFAYTDNLGLDWVDAGTISVPAGYVWAIFGHINILPSGKILCPVYLVPTDNTVNPYLGRFFESTDNGASWTLGTTVASQMKPNVGESGNDAIANGRGIINEFSPIITHATGVDATTKMAAYFRNESYGGYMHYRSSDGGATWTRTGNGLLPFDTPIYNRPVHPILYNGLVYIFCGNRKAGDYGVEYITCTPDQFYNNDVANYSSVVRVYHAFSDSIASDIDFGYSVPFIDSDDQLCVQFYDANPSYVAPIDWEDIKQIVIKSAASGYSFPQQGDMLFKDSHFQYSRPGYAKTGFTARSPHGFVEFRTAETNISVKVGGNWSTASSSIDEQSDIEVLVDGVYNQSVRLTADNTTQTIPITLPAGTKIVRLVNGYTANNGVDINTPDAGVYVQGVTTTGDIEIKTPTVPTELWGFDGDSITTGASGTHPAVTGFPGLFRADGRNVVVDSWGARSLATSSTVLADQRAAFVSSLMNGSSVNKWFISLGTNNFGLLSHSKATFKTYYGLYLDALHTLRPDIEIWCVSPFNRNTYDTPNSGGASLEDYANAIRELLATRAWAKFIYGKDLLSLSNLSDGVHPNQTGMQEIHDKMLIAYTAGGNSITITTSPSVIADDTANTLQFTSTYGDSEIEVSENGGAYTAYTGTINVGNVVRASGYWKAKIKAATGRTQSAVVQSPAFTVPNSIPSDFIWKFDAATGVTMDGSNKVSAVDLGGGLSAVMATAAKQPLYVASAINGLPAIRFDGTDDAMTINYNPALSAFTFLVVFKPNSVAGTQALVEHTSRYGIRIATAMVGVLATTSHTTASVFSTTIAATTTPEVMGMRYQSSNFKSIYKSTQTNLTSDRTGDVFASSTYGLSIGGYITGTGGYFNGDIARIYFYDRYLSDAEFTAAAAELKSTFGTT